MAQTRYFQHLNENDTDFQKVTTLEYIDNSEGFLMYYFKDGSKCNKNFIAPVNAKNIQGFEFAEISSQSNKWNLKYVLPNSIIEKPKPLKADNGVLYEAPDWSDYTHGQKKATARIDIVSRPVPVNNYVLPNDSDYFYENLKNAQELSTNDNFDFNSSNKINVEDAQFTEVKEDIQQIEQKVIENHNDFNAKVVHINVDWMLNKCEKVIINFPDGKELELNPVDFIENAVTPKEEKIVEKVVEKEVLVKTSDTDIEIGVDAADKELLNHMIDRSNKIECAIDMELVLKLPSVDIYKMFKNSYPEGMSKGFVNIIANRMQIKELKTSVAEGLLAFYDEENDNSSNAEKDNSDSNNKKPGRKKQTV